MTARVETMFAPNEFTIGPVCTANGLTLLLPRGKHEATMLISGASGNPTAVILDGQFRFASLSSADNKHWSGILVPNVALEVDETSVVDPAIGWPTGSVIRKQTYLFVAAQDRPHAGRAFVQMVAGLPPCDDGASAVFSRWQVVIGEGRNRRVIRVVDVTGS